jgi:hypothetical protein
VLPPGAFLVGRRAGLGTCRADPGVAEIFALMAARRPVEAQKAPRMRPLDLLPLDAARVVHLVWEPCPREQRRGAAEHQLEQLQVEELRPRVWPQVVQLQDVSWQALNQQVPLRPLERLPFLRALAKELSERQASKARREEALQPDQPASRAPPSAPPLGQGAPS